MPQNMRIWITGSSGSGKSTLGRRLALALDLPLVHLDQLYFDPGWQEPPEGRFEDRVTRTVAEPDWIIDGGFTSKLGDLVPRHATHIIYFDIPRWQCMWGVTKRILTGYGQVRPDSAPGCPERFDPGFIKWVWNYKRDVNPRIEELIAAKRPDQTAITLCKREEGDAVCTALQKIRFSGTD